MILRELVDWWAQQPDQVPTGYQPAFLTKAVVLDGKSARLQSIGAEKRGTRTGLWYRAGVPRVKRSGTAPKPSLLADNATYALGLVREKDKPKDVAAKHQAFVDLIRACADITQAPEVEAVLHFLESAQVEQLRADPNLDPMDDLVYMVNDRFVSDLPAVRRFWADFVSPKEDAVTGTCLVTGETTAIALRHPYKIKGVPGGQAQGTDLISVNNASGESYGLEAALNSPVGSATAEALCNGLNALLSTDRHHVRMLDTAFVWWQRGGEDLSLYDVLEPSPEAVGNLLRAVAKGSGREEPSEHRFFMMALSNNVSRTVIRAEYSMALIDAKRHIARWFQRLELYGTQGRPLPPLGVYRLASSLYRDPDDVPKRVPVGLTLAALTGQPPPYELLQAAVRRNRAEGGPHFTNKANQKQLATARLALTRAILTDHYPSLTPMLNPDLDAPAYQCGRLLSVLESIQRVAIPGLNATLTDKHYAAAAATPGLIFGTLLKDAIGAHLPKLRKNRMGAYQALDKKLQEVTGKLTAFPATLTYEEQGLFSLGYYHQKAADIAAAQARNLDLAEIATDSTPREEEAQD